MPANLKPEQLEQIKKSMGGDKTQREVAKEMGISLSAVRYNLSKIRKGKFEQVMERAVRLASGLPKSTGHPRSVVRNPSPATIRNIQHLRAQGMKGSEVAKKLNVSASMVYYYAHDKKEKAQPSENKQERLTRKIQGLREKGLTIKVISEKLHVPTGTISYRLYGNKNGRTYNEQKELTNGAGSPTANGNGFNKHVCVGIAFAETERFIGVLSERLGVPAAFLRPRLSELLGHSPLRETPGDGN
jgi:predicted transcriptional regulator